MVPIPRSRGNRWHIKWACRCDCGRSTVVTSASLGGGHTLSCGCGTIDAVRAARFKHGHSKSGGGGRPSKTYTTWMSMITRCRRPHRLYSDRGISVCDRWSVFANFLADMGERPDGMTIDRVDSNKNYEPGNCRWATPLEQGNNTRSCRFLTLRGVTKTLRQWSRCLGMSASGIAQRIDRFGWSVERALTTPPSPVGPQSARDQSYRGPTKLCAPLANLTMLPTCSPISEVRS